MVRAMAIQIFGKSKCFDTKKAERWFKERNIKVQNIDILSKGLSRGEFDSVVKALGGIDELIDTNSKDPINLISETERKFHLYKKTNK